jgi:hypothetical protein
MIQGQWTSNLDGGKFADEKIKFKEHPCIKNKIPCNIKNGKVDDESYDKIEKIIKLSYFLLEKPANINDITIYKHKDKKLAKIQIERKINNNKLQRKQDGSYVSVNIQDGSYELDITYLLLYSGDY